MTPTVAEASIINARPKPFLLPSGRVALVIIDMQRDFVQQGGYGSYQCASKEIFAKVSESIGPLKSVLEMSRKSGVTVIHTREGHEADLPDCPPSKLLRQKESNPSQHTLCIGDNGPMGRLLVRGEYGHDIIDDLKPLRNEIVLDKPAKGSFCNTNFYEILTASGISHIVLTGVTTECCVATTFREANDRGFECCVLADCTGGFDPNIEKWTLEGFCAYDGLFGYLSNSTDFIDSLELYNRPIPDYVGPLSYAKLSQTYQTETKPADFIRSILEKSESHDALGLLLNSYLDINQQLNALEKLEDDPPALYGVPFITTGDVSSLIIQHAVDLGAIHIGSLPESNPVTGFNNNLDSVFDHDLCSFVISTDYDGSSHIMASSYNNKSVYSFVPSPRGVLQSKQSTSHLSIISCDLSIIRQLWVRLVCLDTMGNYPTPPIDYRHIADRGINIGLLTDGELHSDFQELAQEICLLTSSPLVEIGFDKWDKYVSTIELLHNQEKLSKMHVGQASFAELEITYLKDFEIPGWEVSANVSMAQLLETRFRDSLGPNKAHFLLASTLPSGFNRNCSGNMSVKEAISTKRNVFAFNSLNLPTITLSAFGQLSITVAARPGMDWEMLDFVQYLVKDRSV
ncbi:hypothetical protein AWJ20_2333 [Sugiyamaella lignohabitans]|uniref:Isochorismatase-like domain-containing protein n=1 Tax=Sugiyamaella lignohabitans TaxID=796027 RepID=A0A167F241_9ASCO|nr:uncharacterized protein AWJ20_2333 [Sugiyamaella lignohabitans]ANB14726.1 hypothetical protein AWJ20_2333 [Sugiyamaella lignohabitans]